MSEAKETLKQTVYKLSPLEDFEWEDFSACWHPVKFCKGDFIIKYGQVEKYFYFVHHGVVRAFIQKDDQEVSVGFSYDTEFTGAYDSFLAQQPTDFYIEAITEASLLRITYHDFNESV